MRPWAVLGIIALTGCRGAARAPAPPAIATPSPSPSPSPSIDRGDDAGWLGVVVGDVIDVAAPLDARVTALLVHVGDRVSAGAALARLDRAALDQDLAMAIAAARAARASRDKAAIEVDLMRERAARRSGSVELSSGSVELSSAEERSTARHEAQLAAARLRAAEADVAERAARVTQLQALSREAELRAPCDGVVAAELVAAGAQARRGAPLLRLSSGGTPRVRFAVPEADLGRVRVGDGVRVTAGARSVGGTVARLAPEINRSARMLFVEATLERDGDGEALRLGEVTRVQRREAP